MEALGCANPNDGDDSKGAVLGPADHRDREPSTDNANENTTQSASSSSSSASPGTSRDASINSFDIDIDIDINNDIDDRPPSPGTMAALVAAPIVFTERIAEACTSSILLEQLLFFLAGLGSSIGYISSLSSLVYFKLLFGPDSFVYLNCAVFFPLLPISLAQAAWDSVFDAIYQSRVTFLVRAVVGFGFVVVGTLGMAAFGRQHPTDSIEVETEDEPPPHLHGLSWVIASALLQGIGGAVLFGQLNQLASIVGNLHTAADVYDTLPKKFKAAVSAGVQASALVVLAVSVSSGFGTMNGERFAPFCQSIVYAEVFCFGAGLWLLVARPRVRVSMQRRDASMTNLAAAEVSDPSPSSSSLSSPSELEDFNELLSLLPGNPNRDGLLLRQLLPQEQRVGDSHTVAELSIAQLFYCSRSPCYGMALVLVPSFLVGSWFTHVQTDWMELAQILFYTRIGSDLAGRFATILVPPSSMRCVLWVAGLRWILVVLFFLNAEKRIGADRGEGAAKAPRDDSLLLRGSPGEVQASAAWEATATAPTQTQRDCLTIALVATIAFFSGYLVTSCYQLAPQLLPGTPEQRAANAARQASLLTVAFSVSAIAGLVTNFVFLAIGV